MVEADTCSGKDGELVDSGVDEELEPPDEEAVFSDPDEDDDGAEANGKSENRVKDYEFKPIEKEGMDDGEEGDSNEDITELEELENLVDELKDLVVKFSNERCAIPPLFAIFHYWTWILIFHHYNSKLVRNVVNLAAV